MTYQIQVKPHVPLRGYHGDCRHGTAKAIDSDGSVVVTMDEPNESGARVAGPFRFGEYDITQSGVDSPHEQ